MRALLLVTISAREMCGFGRARALSIAVVVCSASLLLAGSAGAGSAYSDPAGDAVFASDVTRVIVTNNKAGLLTFTVRLSPQPRRPGDKLFLYLNTDGNRSNGISGHDYAVLFDGGRNAFTVARLKSGKATRLSAKSARSRCCTRGWVFSINRREIGNPSSLEFSVESTSDIPSVRRDRAPDVGLYRYRLS